MEKGVLIKSVSKSISVLQAINRYGSMSIVGIARDGKLPYPTAFRIVQTLVHEGLIEQEPLRKRYRPTALVHSLAHGYRLESHMADVAHEHMSDFTRRMGWPVFVAVRVGTQMVVRDATHGETSLTFDPCYPGSAIPLLTSASGHALLSTFPGEEVDRLLDWARREHLETPDISAQALRDLLAQVQVDGLAAKPCSSSTRTSSLSVPIALEGQRADTVLTLTYFTTAMTRQVAIERFADALKETAGRICTSFQEHAPYC
jgi:IclR family mhp operon transcriptional activator